MEKSIKLSMKHLTANELLSIRRINNKAWLEFNKITQILPKVGLKSYEPDWSLLQNQQIKSALESRKDVLKIERVHRLSNLGTAEWLSNEKKARITKKSSIDWSNYGYVIKQLIYLFPDESLLLLEMNSLELIFNDVSLSVQQAYDILLSSTDTNKKLNEYLVYSQLSRGGYLLKKYQNTKTSNKWLNNYPEQSNDIFSKSIHSENYIVQEILDFIVDKVAQEINKESRQKTLSFYKKNKPRLISEETMLEPFKLIMPKKNLNSYSKIISFAKLPVDSWKELKKKSQKAKAISANNISLSSKIDNVEIIKKKVNPLTNWNSMSNLKEIYDKLKIFTESYGKIKRKRQFDCCISFKLYQKNPLHKKYNSDSPLFNLVVTSEKHKIVQPGELVKLDLDTSRKYLIYAYFSGSSISYTQSGFVSLPKLHCK